MGWSGELDEDLIAGAHLASRDDDGHGAGLAYEVAVAVAAEDGLHEAGLYAVELVTGVAEAGDLDDGAGAQPEPDAGREGEQIEAASGDVLAHEAGGDGEAGGAQFVEKFGVDDVDLAEVWLGGVSGDAGAVLDGLTQVGVAFDAEACEQADGGPRRLRHGV